MPDQKYLVRLIRRGSGSSGFDARFENLVDADIGLSSSMPWLRSGRISSQFLAWGLAVGIGIGEDLRPRLAFEIDRIK